MAAADVLVDTAGFLALWDASDTHHASAVALQPQRRKQRRTFLTTQYVVDATATILLVRHSHAAATDFLETVERSDALRIEWAGPDRFFAASAFFRRRADQQWSFTDCMRFERMRELRIVEAFTTDHHFRLAGFTSLL